MHIDMRSKDKSGALLLIVTGVEVAFAVIASVVGICFYLPLLSYGRIIHYLILCYFMLWLWSSLYDGKIEQRWQLLFFALIPNIEFFAINILGLSNWWGILFLLVYSIVLSIIYDIDTNNGGSSGASGHGNKFIKSAIKGLTKK